MRRTLTRACIICIQAKKRCDKGIPKCGRCVEKGGSCSYQNVPFGHGTKQPQATKAKTIVVGQLSNDENACRPLNGGRLWTRQQGQIFITEGTAVARMPDPVIFLPLDEDSLSDIVRNLNLHPLDFIRKGGTDFIHPCSYRSFFSAPLRIAADVCRIHAASQQGRARPGELKLAAQALLSTANSCVNFTDTLAFVQGLCLLQIVTLFTPTATREEHEEGVQRLQLLRDWSTKLWASAPSSLPSTMSKHDAYVLAEAVRRTIIVSHKILGCYRVLRTGFFMHTIFVESLPFGQKMELWDSEVWQDDISAKPAGLVSYREYCDLWDAGLVHTATAFGRMLLVGFKGKAAVDQRLGAPKGTRLSGPCLYPCPAELNVSESIMPVRSQYRGPVIENHAARSCEYEWKDVALQNG